MSLARSILTLNELIAATDAIRAPSSSTANPVITHITDDSRQVIPGAIFVMRQGHDGHSQQFIGDALARGAVALLASDNTSSDITTASVPLLTSSSPPSTAIDLSHQLYDHPEKKLCLIGITGTNGKTTTAYLVRHLLNTFGHRCGLIGTIEIDNGQTVQPATLTTPGRLELIALLAQMVEHQCDHVVLELSSHALDQGRVDPHDFDIALFTNLTRDHLDYHQTIERYAQAKARLFDQLPSTSRAILNADDPYHHQMLAHCDAPHHFYTPTPGTPTSGIPDPAPTSGIPDPATAPAPTAPNPASIYTAIIDRATPTATHLTFPPQAPGPTASSLPLPTFTAQCPLIGRYNIANLLAAIAATHARCQPTVQQWADAIHHISPIPGRLERILPAAPAPSSKAPPEVHDKTAHRLTSDNLPPSNIHVIVDYAHTDDALAQALTTLRPLTQGRLHVIFGCGGDRDKTKRPLMAQTAYRLADQITITSDNPRTESPDAIIADILHGIPPQKSPDAEIPTNVHVQPDRAIAIEQAIANAHPHDVILIAGKGHETYQIIGAERHHFDDRQIAQRALTARH